MSLNAADIAVLCDVGQAVTFNEERQGRVEELARQGYVTRIGQLYELTPKGEQVLAERGVGINEA